MKAKHLLAATAIAFGALSIGVGPASAALLDPAPLAPIFKQDPSDPPPPGIPAEKCWKYGRSGGGGPRGGGGQPMYPPQCPQPDAPPS
jgi:hypothetical protein